MRRAKKRDILRMFCAVLAVTMVLSSAGETAMLAEAAERGSIRAEDVEEFVTEEAPSEENTEEVPEAETTAEAAQEAETTAEKAPEAETTTEEATEPEAAAEDALVPVKLQDGVMDATYHDGDTITDPDGVSFGCYVDNEVGLTSRFTMVFTKPGKLEFLSNTNPGGLAYIRVYNPVTGAQLTFNWKTESVTGGTQYTGWVRAGTYNWVITSSPRAHDYAGFTMKNICFTGYESSFPDDFGTEDAAQDDTRETANEIRTGTTYNGFVASLALGDASDFYHFTLPAQGKLTVRASDEEGWAWHSLYNESGKQLTHVSNSKTYGYESSYYLMPGDYYYEVYQNDSGQHVSYSFSLDFEEVNAGAAYKEKERNDTRDAAQEISLNRNYGALFATLDDPRDYYRFEVPQDGMAPQLSFTSDVQYVQIYLYDSTGKQLQSHVLNEASAGAGLDEKITFTGAGTKDTYYMLITSHGSSKTEYGPYTFRISSLGSTVMNAPTCTAAGIRVTWPMVTGAVRYVVYRYMGSGSPVWKYLTTVKATDDYVQILNTQAKESGTWYAYSVQAVSEDGTYGVRPAGRSILYRAPVKAVKAETVQRCAGSNKPGVRVTFTTVKAGYTYRLYRSEKSGSTWGAYTKVTDMVKSYNGTDQNVWIYDDTAVSGKTYRYYVRCVSKDGAVPLSSYANYVGITY